VRVWRWVVLAMACVAAVPLPAQAQSLFERLILPGPLAEAHGKLEAECSHCHEAFSRQSQSRLCLDCHKEIARDRDSQVRYHGRQAEARAQDCRFCHTDHKGRDADIVMLDRDSFDHDKTNYPLLDAHKAVPCVACHVQKTAFHRTASTCFDCHKAVEPHKGKLGERCESCHSPTQWRKTIPFDHSKTNFALEGAHRAVACQTCHVGEIYKDLGRTCASCHRLQDVHGERYGSACDTCHDQTSWKAAHFNHDRTSFPLHGAHAVLACDSCHTGALYRDKLQTICVACHRKEDPHKGQLGDRCEKCHGETGWRKDIRFNHNQTNFPLTGLHANVPCAKCHRSLTYKDAPSACEKCHEDSRHQGRLGASPRCETCHNTSGWARWHFDHGRQAKYPLTGAHQKLVCESCHAVRNASLQLPTACGKCHVDFHQSRLGATPTCETCHSTANWPNWHFDHAKQANYPLLGGHLKLKCEACHTAKAPASLKLAADCFSCHRGDDPHAGAFGRFCERCHTPASWRKVEIRN
jgi:hypothetical protein